jgi:hypothetical protein
VQLTGRSKANRPLSGAFAYTTTQSILSCYYTDISIDGRSLTLVRTSPPSPPSPLPKWDGSAIALD